MEAYLILDIGTGNVRAALVDVQGTILSVERDSVRYYPDPEDEAALHFKPVELWGQIDALVKRLLAAHEGVEVIGMTASSQREGIVLLAKDGSSMIGFPNHDFRGRDLEDEISDYDAIYEITGRFPSALFSALKLAGYRAKYPTEWAEFDTFLSISDWAEYQLTGVKSYEHAQASETILYDVEAKQWSISLREEFDFEESDFVPLQTSGTELGKLKTEYCEAWGLQAEIPVFVGGADTQLAVKSTRPDLGDVILVSGTTTPIVMVSEQFILDQKQRSWTNSHLDEGQYILETNCGVTGLNYQRFKDIFYPNDSYDLIEEEVEALSEPRVFANLGSLIADEHGGLTRGGYLFDVPLMTGVSRADFAFATLWDIACSIKRNYDSLLEIQGNEKDYVWCCGGGFQSRSLRKFVAALLNKKLKIRRGFEQASVTGAAVVCAEALGREFGAEDDVEIVEPEQDERYLRWFADWEATRQKLAARLSS